MKSATTQSAPTAALLAADRQAALALTPVSRETLERLDRFVALLYEWQARMNLVAASTLPTIWTRHVADSLQLVDLAPQARIWADIGSGAGFPGLMIACALARTGVASPAATVHLVESNQKKAAFLREAVRVTGAPAIVHAMRAERFVAAPPQPIEIVTARALAPLSDLLALLAPLMEKGAKALLPKGQDVAVELTKASKCWNIEMSLVASKTSEAARIAVVTSAQRIDNIR
ncbi:MAG: 16S rRNA (guanine(527)-N(7))-methyltransferase RsmG [Proteobacteria bacterium]|nr:16S rRNA (guanine(527)-N(7))-methyltransferase RsmG [Pseudomonadota bacterium]